MYNGNVRLRNVGTGVPDGPPENAEHFPEYGTQLPRCGRTVREAGPYIPYSTKCKEEQPCTP